MDSLYITEIQTEYKKIDEKWLHLHFKTSVALVLFTFFVECTMGVFLYKMGEIHSTIPHYLLKFLFAPFVLNTIFVAIEYLALYRSKFSQNVKIYIVSLIFVMICFVLFSVHIIFSSLYFIFVIPILLTIIYGDYVLTTITSIASMLCVILSEFFIKWDSEKLSIITNGQRLADFILSLCILCAFSAVCMVVIHFEKEKNAASIQKELERYRLKKKIQLDELTGINNRTALQSAINDMELDKSNNCYTLAMIDLDNFKKLNDNFGHIMGDKYLIEFGKILKSNCKNATPFRYGGDEFCILFQNCTLKNVVKTCEIIQQDIKTVDMGIEIDFALTASIGIATYMKNMDITRLFINTDKALYESKEKKDAIRIYEEME